METITESRSCLACSKPLRGRVDKKYCDDYCRNHYNNQEKAKSAQSPYVRNVNNTLLRNRRILAALLPVSEAALKASRDKLALLGFNFNYLTHTHTTRSGKTYRYCYDYGYLPLGNERLLIVRKSDD